MNPINSNNFSLYTAAAQPATTAASANSNASSSSSSVSAANANASAASAPAQPNFLKILNTERPKSPTSFFNPDDYIKDAMDLQEMQKSEPELYEIFKNLAVDELPDNFDKLVEEYLKEGDENFYIKSVIQNGTETEVICMTFFTTMMDWFSRTTRELAKEELALKVAIKLESDSKLSCTSACSSSTANSSSSSSAKPKVAELTAKVKVLKKNQELLRSAVKKILAEETVHKSPVGFRSVYSGNTVNENHRINFTGLRPLNFAIECDDVELFLILRKRGARVYGENLKGDEQDQKSSLWEYICDYQAKKIAHYVIENTDIYETDYMDRTLVHHAVDMRAADIIETLHDKFVSSRAAAVEQTAMGAIFKDMNLSALNSLCADSASSDEFFKQPDENGNTPFMSFVSGITPDKEKENKSLDAVFKRGGKGVCSQALIDKGVEILTNEQFSTVLEKIKQYGVGKVRRVVDMEEVWKEEEDPNPPAASSAAQGSDDLYNDDSEDLTSHSQILSSASSSSSSSSSRPRNPMLTPRPPTLSRLPSPTFPAPPPTLSTLPSTHPAPPTTFPAPPPTLSRLPTLTYHPPTLSSLMSSMYPRTRMVKKLVPFTRNVLTIAPGIVPEDKRIIKEPFVDFGNLPSYTPMTAMRMREFGEIAAPSPSITSSMTPSAYSLHRRTLMTEADEKHSSSSSVSTRIKPTVPLFSNVAGITPSTSSAASSSSSLSGAASIQPKVLPSIPETAESNNNAADAGGDVNANNKRVRENDEQASSSSDEPPAKKVKTGKENNGSNPSSS